MKATCETCKFMVRVGEDTGVCYRLPPQIVPAMSSSPVSAYPPVKPSAFWCGEHKRAKAT